MIIILDTSVFAKWVFQDEENSKEAISIQMDIQDNH